MPKSLKTNLFLFFFWKKIGTLGILTKIRMVSEFFSFINIDPVHFMYNIMQGFQRKARVPFEHSEMYENIFMH
jgi:hypothetical protein